MLTVTIGGADRTALVRAKELQVEAKLTSEPDVCRFPLVSPDGSYEPPEGEEIIVTDEAGTRVFGGVLNRTDESGAGGRRFVCEGIDFTPDLDCRLLVDSYGGQTAGAIVRDWVSKVNEYLPPGKQFTANGVQDGPLVTQLKANYQPFSLLMEKLNRLTGYEWYVDYHRDVKFFAKEALTAPLSLRPRDAWSQDGEWFDLTIRRGPVSQIRTRVFVRGATYEGNEMILRFAGDGKQRVFYLGYLARNVRVYKNAVGQLLGLDNIDNARQWYFNYEAMSVRQDESEAVLTAGDELQVVFTPLIPVRVVVQDEDLVAEYGIREHLVQDQSIDTKELARLRGRLELRGRAVGGSFSSLVTGWHPGQTLAVDVPARGLSGVTALVTRTAFQYAGNLNRYITRVEFEVI